MKKRVLISGGAGFLGSHLCDRLMANGDSIVVIDNFQTGQLRNVQQHLNNSRFQLLEQDIAEPVKIDVDQIFNLACAASPVQYQQNPIHTMATSVLGAINTLSLAEALDIPLLQASTSEVYGDPESHPQNEEYRGRVNCVGPRACYDEGKRCAETLCYDYKRGYGVDVRVARIFNTYGPRMHPNDGRVVSNFIVQALRGKPLTIYGSGNQTRSFCYVDDLIDGLLRLMSFQGTLPGPINLGNPHEMAIGDLAERIVAIIGSQSKIEVRPLPEDDPTRRCPNIARAIKLLDWQPVTTLEQGLDRTIAYFDNILAKDAIAAKRGKRHAA